MPVSIRPFAPADFEGMMTLVRTCYGRNAEPPGWWRWRHFSFPEAPTTIFLAVDAGQIVGMRPMALFDYYYFGERLRGALFSAVMVHPHYRRQGIFTSLVRACVEEAWRQGAAFATTMPNASSRPGFIELGWESPGERRLLVRPFFGRGPAPSSPGDHRPGLSVERVLDQRDSATLMIEAVERFGSDADLLIKRVGDAYQGLILDRTSTWLNWRYETSEWASYTRFEVRDAEGVLRGLTVTAHERRYALHVGYLVDLLAEDEMPRRALIRTSLEDLRRRGCSIAATVVSAPASIRELRREGFVPIPYRLSPKRFYTFYTPSPDSRRKLERLRTLDHWYQTLGDWDGL